jgi:D-alanyl-D-alanine carboxypeptidase
MNNEDRLIIETEELSVKNRFPIVLQVVVLMIILLGIFGVTLFRSTNSGSTTDLREVVPAQVPLSQTKDQNIPQKLGDIAIVGKSAYVWDVRAQRALYSKNADKPLPLASLTKLMTSLLAYELIEANAETTVPLSAVRQESSGGLSAGEKFTIDSLQQLSLISSSNGAAYTLAASVGSLLGERDPVGQFLAGMNIRAQELGLTTLSFKNATGLDISSTEPGAIGTARDITFLLEHILNTYPDIVDPTRLSNTRVYDIQGIYHEVENTNGVLDKIPNLIASKTGFTDLAGGNLIVAFDLGFDRPIIVTVLGSTRSDRFVDVLTLIEAVQKAAYQPEN